VNVASGVAIAGFGVAGIVELALSYLRSAPTIV
jgi:hypothetical protein